MAYWALADLQNRISAEAVRQILDDNNDGTADGGPVALLQTDSDSFVDGYLIGVYPLDLVRAAPPNTVKRLSLDMAVVYARQRFPEYVRGTWKDLFEVTTKQLEAIRDGKVRLDVEPAVHEAVGGDVWAGGDDLTVENEPIFNGPPGTMGDYSP